MLRNAMEHLAGLTALRDRDQFDLALAQALAQVFDARAVGLYRVVHGKHGHGHWLNVGFWQEGQAVVADPNWVDVEQLPVLDDFPLRVSALEDQLFIQVPSNQGEQGTWLTVMPLMSERFQQGIVELRTSEPLSPALVKSVESFLQVIRNHQGLLDTAQTDPLTGLLNRQTFDATFMAASVPPPQAPREDIEERRLAVGDTWWLAVLDIDHFKLVNDRFGHLIGDEVLVLVSRLMKQSFRPYDRLFRFGGEEFVVMVRCPLEIGAMTAFERFRANMAAYAFPQVGQVTISIGVTQVFMSDAPSIAFSRADEAVYQAKHRGRNQVLSYSDLVAQGVVKSAVFEGDVELF